MVKSSKLISYNKLFNFKHSKLATIERQQILYRLSIKNPLYKIIDSYQFYCILSEVANKLHFTIIEICALSLLLESLSFVAINEPKQLIYFSSYVVKSSIADQSWVYEKIMIRNFKNFDCRYSNWLLLNNIRTDFNVNDLSEKYKELMFGNIVAIKDKHDIEIKLNQMFVKNCKRIKKSPDVLDLTDHLVDLEKKFFGEALAKISN